MDKTLELEQVIGQKLLLGFDGTQISAPLIDMLRQYKAAGVTLFRSMNVEDPAQVRRLTDDLQRVARQAGLPPLLVALDQEGGQLMAFGDGTPFPGNLALGAVGSTDLAYQTGRALGRELAAVGVNINYAPVCDVNINPRNPGLGVRSYGEDPRQVAELAAAAVRGIQSVGVAATAKHFPGHGDTSSDSHHGTPVVEHDLKRLREVELPPFAAAIQAGVHLVMSAHIALPQVAERGDLPATLSRRVLHGILRQELGFEGLIVTDAMDMKAIRQGEAIGEEAVAAAAAGADLLLLTRFVDQGLVYHTLLQAAQRGLLSSDELHASSGRVQHLKSWLAGQSQPDLGVVGCAEHQALALETARRSVTVVRDQGGRLPLPRRGRWLAALPIPDNLTPADTSSMVKIMLADMLRRYHPEVVEFNFPLNPSPEHIRALLAQIEPGDQVILGTIDAATQPGQAELARAVLDSGAAVTLVALRTPYDLEVFPQAPLYLCTYSILESSMQALAEVLCGEIPAQGRLPVSIPGLYARGHCWR